MTSYYLTLSEAIDMKIISLRDNDIKHVQHIMYDCLLDEDNQSYIDANNPKKHCDIRIIRSCAHDGTLIFEHELIADAYLCLVNKTVNDKNFPDKIPTKYIVGKIRVENEDCDITNEYGIRLQCRTKVSIPVKFVYEDK